MKKVSKKFFSCMFIVAAFCMVATVAACSEESTTGPTRDSQDNEVLSSSAEKTVASSSSRKMESSSSATAKSSSATALSSETESSSSESVTSENWREYCLEVINNYRATEGADPLTLAHEEKQTCTDTQAAADMEQHKAHGNFGDCGESAQNSGPNIPLNYYNTEKRIVDTYLNMMWEEKELVLSGERDPNNDDDYSYIGHYLNMRNKKYTSVSCGLAKTSDEKTGWFNINFYR